MSKLNGLYYEKYVRFQENLHNYWIQYCIQPEIVRVLGSRCQDSEYRNQVQVDTESPVNPERRPRSRLRGENIRGAVERFSRRELPEALFISAISLFEAFVSDIARAAYLDRPRYLLATKQGRERDDASDRENEKVLAILVESSSRDDAIEQCVEERLRSIFYGNPVDVFRKNKLRLNIHEELCKVCDAEIAGYSEIIARRNIFVHNRGIADRKYVREVEGTGSALPLKARATVTEIYLHASIRTLNVLAKEFANLVALRTTGESLPQTRIGVLKARVQ